MAGHFTNVYWKRIFMSNKRDRIRCFCTTAYVVHFSLFVKNEKSNSFFFFSEQIKHIPLIENQINGFHFGMKINKMLNLYYRSLIVILMIFKLSDWHSIRNFIQAHKFHHLWLLLFRYIDRHMPTSMHTKKKLNHAV